MHRSRALALVALALVAACPRPAPSPAPPAAPVVAPEPPPPLPLDRDLPRLAVRATQLYQEVVQAFAAAGEDCAAAAAGLTGLQRGYADVIAASAKVVHEGRDRELATALEAHATELDAAAKTIVEGPTLAACAQDASFTRAFDALVAAPPAPTSTSEPAP